MRRATAGDAKANARHNAFVSNSTIKSFRGETPRPNRAQSPPHEICNQSRAHDQHPGGQSFLHVNRAVRMCLQMRNFLRQDCIAWTLVALEAFAGLPAQFLALGLATKRTCCVMRHQFHVGDLLVNCVDEGRPLRLRSCGLLDTPAHRVPIKVKLPASCIRSA